MCFELSANSVEPILSACFDTLSTCFGRLSTP